MPTAGTWEDLRSHQDNKRLDSVALRLPSSLRTPLSKGPRTQFHKLSAEQRGLPPQRPRTGLCAQRADVTAQDSVTG